jgi:excisionase family DNA binding protein
MREAQSRGHLVTLDELSAFTGLNRETITRLAIAGAIPSFKFGRQYRFDVAAVLDAARAVEPAASGAGGHE